MFYLPLSPFHLPFTGWTLVLISPSLIHRSEFISTCAYVSLFLEPIFPFPFLVSFFFPLCLSPHLLKYKAKLLADFSVLFLIVSCSMFLIFKANQENIFYFFLN